MYQNFSIAVVLVRRQLDLETVRLILFSLIPSQVPLKISDGFFYWQVLWSMGGGGEARAREVHLP